MMNYVVVIKVLYHLAEGLAHITVPVFLLLIYSIRTVWMILRRRHIDIEWRDNIFIGTCALRMVVVKPIAGGSQPHQLFRRHCDVALTAIHIRYMLIVDRSEASHELICVKHRYYLP